MPITSFYWKKVGQIHFAEQQPVRLGHFDPVSVLNPERLDVTLMIIDCLTHQVWRHARKGRPKMSAKLLSVLRQQRPDLAAIADAVDAAGLGGAVAAALVSEPISSSSSSSSSSSDSGSSSSSSSSSESEGEGGRDEKRVAKRRRREERRGDGEEVFSPGHSNLDMRGCQSHGAATGMVVSVGTAMLEGMTVRSGRMEALL